MYDVRKYVGIPYGFRDELGLDCYQLCVLVSKEIFGKEIPDYTFGGSEKQVWAGFEENKVSWKEIICELPGDIILLNIHGHPMHCGIVLDNKLMLHSLKGRQSCIESYTSLVWEPRIEGFYRWLPK